jgi:serine/threonine protein phosphatase PrpC
MRVGVIGALPTNGSYAALTAIHSADSTPNRRGDDKVTRRAFNITSVGASHIKKNKICQDCSASAEEDGFAYIVVSDGHGGDDYIRSDKGAEFAVKASSECVMDFVRYVKIEQLRSNGKGLFAQLAKSIISSWNDKVWNHYSQVPLTERELSELSEKAKQKYIIKQRIESLYGATLIMVVVTDEYWFGLHIGDGKCVTKGYDGSFDQPIPWDEKCFLNATTSICDANALNNFRHYFSETIPAAIFIGSDGIDDCFANDTQLHNLYDAIIASFGQNDFNAALDELKDYIPRLSSKGSGDDMSMAAIIDIDEIRSYMNHDYDEKEDDSAGNEMPGVNTIEADFNLVQEDVIAEAVAAAPEETAISETEPVSERLSEQFGSIAGNEVGKIEPLPPQQPTEAVHEAVQDNRPQQSTGVPTGYAYISRKILRQIPNRNNEQ